MVAWPPAATTLRRSSPRDTLPRRSTSAVACNIIGCHRGIRFIRGDTLRDSVHGLYCVPHLRAVARLTESIRSNTSVRFHNHCTNVVRANLCVVSALLDDAARVGFRLSRQVCALLTLRINL